MSSELGGSDIARIAAEANVSIATVSRVLNGRAGVAAETRDRVESAIRDRAYVRRTRATDSAPLIELVLPHFQNAWAVELVRGVQRVARERRMSVVLTNTGDRHHPGSTWVESVIQRDVGAIVMVFADLSAADSARLRARNVPFAILSPRAAVPDDVPSVTSAAWSGAFAATQHLITLRHERIGLITGPPDLMTSHAREAGYRAALESAGLAIDPALIRSGRFVRADGELHGRELLRLPDRPTAIFAGSDNHALGVYTAAREAGLRIPRDLSVVGFDDLEIATLIGPPLTTIRQPLADMAEAATRMALQDDASGARPHLELPTRLVVRGSTAPPPSVSTSPS